MQCKTIGSLIKTLRVEKKLSQEELATLCGYSRSVISMVECDNREPTEELYHLLSSILDFDFISLSNKIHNFHNLEHYLLAMELINLIDLDDDNKIASLLSNDIIVNEFNYGEPLLIKQYCHLLVLLYLENDIDTALTNCCEILEIDINNLSNFTPKINMPNQYYSIIVALTFCFYKQNNLELCLLLNKILIDFLEKTYFNNNINFYALDFYYKKLYITSLNNQADILHNSNNNNLALETCNKAIFKCHTLNILNILPMLLKLKVDILCTLNDIINAKETYIDFKSICRLTNNLAYFDTSSQVFKTNYPSLFA